MSYQNELQAKNDIRHIMNKQTRFLSLSGLAGVSAGSDALIGVYLANKVVEANIHLDHSHDLDELFAIDVILVSNISTLEKQEYLEEDISFVGKKSFTTSKISPLALNAFDQHLNTRVKLLSGVN